MQEDLIFDSKKILRVYKALIPKPENRVPKWVRGAFGLGSGKFGGYGQVRMEHGTGASG